MGAKKRLDGEYLDVYNEIMAEIEVEQINTLHKEEVRNDILDMFLLAQEDSTPVSVLVGSDTKGFVNEVLESLDKGNGILLRVGQVISTLFIGMSAIALIRTKNGVLEFTLDIVFLAMILLVGEGLGRIFSKKSGSGKLRRSKKRKIEWSFNIALIGVGAFMAGFFNIEMPILFVTSSPYMFVIASFIIGFITMIVTDVVLR
ncbi:MAG: hypothetical protein ACRC28_01670 [Clostridium sp.]|uniref:hypothetical protein n=1 Tax=Clostridium sp. TaxID=1506 RepID=UPI003F38ECAE